MNPVPPVMSVVIWPRYSVGLRKLEPTCGILQAWRLVNLLVRRRRESNSTSFLSCSRLPGIATFATPEGRWDSPSVRPVASSPGMKPMPSSSSCSLNCTATVLQQVPPLQPPGGPRHPHRRSCHGRRATRQRPNVHHRQNECRQRSAHRRSPRHPRRSLKISRAKTSQLSYSVGAGSCWSPSRPGS